MKSMIKNNINEKKMYTQLKRRLYYNATDMYACTGKTVFSGLIMMSSIISGLVFIIVYLSPALP